jgi:hypothetical protein
MHQTIIHTLFYAPLNTALTESSRPRRLHLPTALDAPARDSRIAFSTLHQQPWVSS